jgi:hypothetical protein
MYGSAVLRRGRRDVKEFFGEDEAEAGGEQCAEWS